MKLWHKIAVVAVVFAGLAVVAFVNWRRRQPVEKPEPAPVAECVMDALRLIAKLETAGTSPSNVVGRVFDAKGKTADDFRRALRDLPGHSRHVWMPGADRWFLVGHLTTNGVPLAKAMEDFAAMESTRYSPAELFASYVGTVEEVMPAFSSGLKGELLPEWFVTKEIPEIDWLDVSGIDPDIRGRVHGEMRSMQLVRRELLKGNMAAREAKDRKGEQAACEIWARCALRNPNDSMLLERIERLDRNARGFLAVGKLLQAMKCFETIILIQPRNAAAVHNFGMCLKKLGKTEMADQVLRRAEILSQLPAESHSPEASASCDAASGLVSGRQGGDMKAGRALFNGKDLTGWYTYLQNRGRNTDPKGVFSVTNGVIRITGEEFGALVSDEEFSNYHLTLEYRFLGGKQYGWKAAYAPDSGILFHSTGPDGRFGGIWMESLEVNLIKGATGDFWGVGANGSDAIALSAKVGKELLDGKYRIFDPTSEEVYTIRGNTRVCRLDISRDWRDSIDVPIAVNEKPIGEWNVVDLYCVGGEVLVSVNGKYVNRGFDAKPTKGRLQLQSEGCAIEFRNVYIAPQDVLPAAIFD